MADISTTGYITSSTWRSTESTHSKKQMSICLIRQSIYTCQDKKYLVEPVFVKILQKNWLGVTAVQNKPCYGVYFGQQCEGPKNRANSSQKHFYFPFGIGRAKIRSTASFSNFHRTTRSCFSRSELSDAISPSQ